MKNLLFLFVSALLLSATLPTETTNTEAVSLEHAVKNKLVSMAVHGNLDSPHYMEPLRVKLRNLTQKSQHIRIANGRIFTSTDPDEQDIIVTQEELIALQPGQAKSFSLRGMCVQQYNSAPGDSSTYSLGAMAEGDLLKLTQKIQESQAFSVAGQQSVWALTDGNSLENIESYLPEEGAELSQYVANILDRRDTVITRVETVVINDTPKVAKRNIKGNFKYKISKESAVSIAMFNEQNIVVKELYNDPTTAAGSHQFDYGFDTRVFTDEFYYIRLIIDGEIKINFTMKPRRT